ncbi:hypothetical protein IJD44_02785 [bacterium]|nr:hypothetical protein [bacterium]
MGYQDLYNWQLKDWDVLTDCLAHRIVFIHGKEFETEQNVAIAFFKEIESTKDYNIFQIESRNPNREVSFLTFYECLLQYKLQPNPSIVDLGKNIFKDITQSETIGYLLDVNTSLSKNVLNGQYRDLLIFIEELSKGISPIFLFYNFSCYDEESQILIQWMASGKLDDFYPCLKKAKYIFLCDENETFDEYSTLHSLKHIDLTLCEPKVEHIPEIWNSYTTAIALSSKDIQKIYSFSGGKLSNIQLIMQYLSLQNKIEWFGNDFNEFMTKIYDKRLSSLRQWECDVKKFLEIASEIGEKFNLDWLRYSLSKNIKYQYNDLLTKCYHEQFINYTNNYGCFTNKFAWQYFNNSTSSRKKEIALMLVETVNYFSPHDYYSRAYYIEQSGDEKSALEIYIFEYWNRLKENIPIPKKLKEKINRLNNKYHYYEYVNLIEKYYSKLSSGQYYDILSILEEAETMRIQPLRLLLLKDYLLACIYHKISYDKDMNERSILLLEHIIKECQEYGEKAFECECMTTLISFYANRGETNKALGVSKSLMYYYSQRKDIDVNAMHGIQVLNRKSSAFLSVEIATKKTEESKNYFKDTILYSQYIMALNNYGANLFVLGKFDAALKYLQEAKEFICVHPTVNVNPVYIWNNFYLASFYSDIHNREKLIIDMKQVVDKLEDTELKVIPLINLSIFYVLGLKKAGITSALMCLEQAKMINYELQDDYYNFYINTNLAAIYFLEQKYELATECIKKCLEPPALFKASEKMYAKKRTNEWLKVMLERTQISCDEFDTYLLNKEPYDTAWNFRGRGFLPSDIQFWSES